jgi:orotate phosphoribosyltransferase-like protein
MLHDRAQTQQRSTRKRRGPLDKAAYDALKSQGLSDCTIAHQLDIPQSTFRHLKRRLQPTIPDAAPVQSPVQSTVQTDALAELSQRLSVVEAFMAAMQAQNGHSITVHTLHGAAHYALPRFDDPADAKAERWNVWIPRGLRRRIEAQASAIGIAPSRRLVALLWTALQTEESQR